MLVMLAVSNAIKKELVHFIVTFYVDDQTSVCPAFTASTNVCFAANTAPGNPSCVAPSFLETRNTILDHSFFVFLQKWTFTPTMKNLHFFKKKFTFSQGFDGVDFQQNTSYLEALNAFSNIVKWFYAILVEQINHICTLLQTGWLSLILF